MSNIRERLQQAQQQPTNTAGAATTQDAMKAAKEAATATMESRGSEQGQATTSTGGTQARPVTFNAADIQRKVESYTDDIIKERLNNSKAEITQLLAKQPNAYKVITTELGENKLFNVHSGLVEKIEGLTADTEFPLKAPKTTKATIDGYYLRKPDASGNLGPEEIVTKKELGDWIRNFALVRIGTEERGARIAEKKVLNAELPYSVTIWGLDAAKASDVTETFEEDKEADRTNKRFYLNTGDQVFKDATGAEVKLYTMIPYPKFIRQEGRFLDHLGPIKMNHKRPPSSKFEIAETLKTLAKIAILDDMKKAQAAD